MIYFDLTIYDTAVDLSIGICLWYSCWL